LIPSWFTANLAIDHLSLHTGKAVVERFGEKTPAMIKGFCIREQNNTDMVS